MANRGHVGLFGILLPDGAAALAQASIFGG
jgi:hypothetical protein